MERYSSQVEYLYTSVWAFEEQVHKLNEAELCGLIIEHDQVDDGLFYSVSEVVGLYNTADPRSNGEPYCRHPLRVAARVLNSFDVDDRVTLVAALHHDTIEERTIAYNGDRNRKEAMSIMEQSNFEVAKVVDGLTNPEYPRDITQDEKNELYLQHVIENCDKDQRVLIIKLADFLDNTWQLDEIADKDMGERLSKKYYPLVRYFSERLGDDDVTLLSENKKDELKLYLDHLGMLLAG